MPAADCAAREAEAPDEANFSFIAYISPSYEPPQSQLGVASHAVVAIWCMVEQQQLHEWDFHSRASLRNTRAKNLLMHIDKKTSSWLILIIVLVAIQPRRDIYQLIFR